MLNGEIVIPSISNELIANGIISRISSYNNESDKRELKREKSLWMILVQILIHLKTS